MYKFRTMKIDSHELREDLKNLNSRKGPLFKIDNDQELSRIYYGLEITALMKYTVDKCNQRRNVTCWSEAII